jgi:hypothetical protein
MFVIPEIKALETEVVRDASKEGDAEENYRYVSCVIVRVQDKLQETPPLPLSLSSGVAEADAAPFSMRDFARTQDVCRGPLSRRYS